VLVGRIEHAEGGDKPRLWATKGEAQLTDTGKGGGWTQFEIKGAGSGACTITAPDGPEGFRKVRFEKRGGIRMRKISDGGSGSLVVLTEVESGKSLPEASTGKPQEGTENGKIHVTKRNEKDAMEFLAKRPKDKPFCLTVAFFAPHAEDYNKNQYLPQSKTMELYKDATIPTPKVDMAESWARMPSFFKKGNEGRTRWKWRFDNPDKYQRMMKNYYRLITEVDGTCGVILDELKKQGVLDNTLVIFTTDNGYYHGEHGLADKWYPHEESIRVPLIIVDPRMKQGRRGTTNDDFTLSVDLAPTIIKAAGLDLPARMQGTDISPLYLANKKPEWRQEFFYEHPQIRGANFIPASQALVRKEWKYMYWPAFKTEQLFHLKTDPNEEKDLINDSKHASVLEEMRTRFAELKKAAK
jgi:arylsulfatase A-like enzyme